MPYQSQAQRRYMHAAQPKVAAKWDAKYDTPKDLPERATAYKRAAEREEQRA